MRLLTIIFMMSLFSTYAEDLEIGQVVILRGEAQVNRNNQTNPIEVKYLVNELDVISTKEKSLVKITFEDNTNLILGPNSKLQIQKYSKKDRVNIFNFIKGNFRAKIQEKVSENQKVEFLSNQVAVGVRGTEFLANSYVSNSIKVSDIVLLEGNLNTAVDQSERFILKAGEAINTNTYKATHEVKKLDPKVLADLLNDELKLLPNMLDAPATIKKIESSLPTSPKSFPSVGLALGAAVGTTQVLGLSTSEDERPLLNETKKLLIKHKSDLKKEPWDIRDALIRRDELKIDNTCFYWFYKALPGSGELERFRRERDCDEFEYDL